MTSLVNKAEFNRHAGSDKKLNKEEFVAWLKSYDSQSGGSNGQVVKKSDGWLNPAELREVAAKGLDVSQYAAKLESAEKWRGVAKFQVRDLKNSDINWDIETIANALYKDGGEKSYDEFSKMFKVSRLKGYYMQNVVITTPQG